VTIQPFLHVHHRETASRSNGPGLRAVIWTQGCSLGCPGCFNPETHPAQAGQFISIEELTAWSLAQPAPLDGLTISGGEPFQQPQALAALLSSIRNKSSLSTIVFTGYTQKELANIPFAPNALAHIDLLISGRYNQSQRIASGLIGSANKTFHFLTSRYTMADLRSVPDAEIWIKPDGSVSFSGINPLQW
jgi:anaerobic ribonucleoside-triphosphate reductase activating protein